MHVAIFGWNILAYTYTYIHKNIYVYMDNCWGSNVLCDFMGHFLYIYIYILSGLSALIIYLHIHCNCAARAAGFCMSFLFCFLFYQEPFVVVHIWYIWHLHSKLKVSEESIAKTSMLLLHISINCRIQFAALLNVTVSPL